MFCVCLCKLTPEYEQRLKEGGEIDLVPQEEEILMADWIDLIHTRIRDFGREVPCTKK